MEKASKQGNLLRPRRRHGVSHAPSPARPPRPPPPLRSPRHIYNPAAREPITHRVSMPSQERPPYFPSRLPRSLSLSYERASHCACRALSESITHILFWRVLCVLRAARTGEQSDDGTRKDGNTHGDKAAEESEEGTTGNFSCFRSSLSATQHTPVAAHRFVSKQLFVCFAAAGRLSV